MLSKTLSALVLTLAFALPALAATPVDVNHADANTIAQSLDGVGLGKAQAIVAYRDAHGPFKHAEDLEQVKGIGPATLARNHDAIKLKGGQRVAKNTGSHKSATKARKRRTAKHAAKS